MSVAVHKEKMRGISFCGKRINKHGITEEDKQRAGDRQVTHYYCQECKAISEQTRRED